MSHHRTRSLRRSGLRMVALAASLAAGHAWAGSETGTNTYYGLSAGNAGGGSYNSFFGSNSGYATTGNANSFFGRYSGYDNTTGYQNVFLGYVSGYNNTTGFNNVYAGYYAGWNNTTGQENVVTGSNAAYSATTGSFNVYSGSSAAYNGSGGERNVHVGYKAGYNAGSASDNAFVGMQAGYATTSGTLNAFFGTNAGHDNTVGSYNTFAGVGAGYSNVDGASNTLLGYLAGYNSTTANGNVYVGRSAGYGNTTGSRNVALGFQAGQGSKTENFNTYVGAYTRGTGGASGSTAIGYRAQVTEPNTVIIGAVKGTNDATASPNVGIGTTAPTAPLHVVRDGNSTTEAMTVEQVSNTLADRTMLQMNNQGGLTMNFTDTSRNQTWAIRTDRNGSSNFEISLLGSGGNEFILSSGGNLTLRGTLQQNSNVHDKTGIVPVDGVQVLARVQALPVSTWRYKTAPTVEHLGPMAQDFYAAFGLGDDETKLAPGDMAGVALAAIQQQQKLIEQLQAQVRALQHTVQTASTPPACDSPKTLQASAR